VGLTKEAEDFLKRVGDTDMEIPDRTHTRKIFQLTECSDSQLSAPEYRGSSGMFYVTQSSCEVVDELGRPSLFGKCHRQIWYSKNGYEREPIDSIGLRRMRYGVHIEKALQDNWNKGGIYVQNNVKIRSHEYNVSGEIDAIVFDHEANHPIIVEVKSGYGYTFNKNVFGRANNLYPTGFPHRDYIMQVMWYLHLRKPLEKVHGESPYALLYYIDRSDCRDKQFPIDLEESYTGRAIVRNEFGSEITPNPAYRIANRGCVRDVEIRPIQGLTMERIIERFKTLATKLKSDKPPEREFFMRYPDEMAEDLFETGLLSKTKWNEHQKDASAPVGDWNCSYCSFSAECYPEGADTDISADKNLVKRNVRLSEEDGEKFLKSGKLPVVA
jgi:CRISPR/Cas system-associated exonuclease Cas4 (RecB family)